MKKLILAFLMAGTIMTVNAQEPKSLLVYGDIGLIDGTNDSLTKTIIWDANFGIGYQFNQYWTIGGSLCWGQHAVRDSGVSKNTENIYRVGPFVRFSHYINNSNIFFWYAQFDLQYQGGYHTYNNGDPNNNKHTGIYAGLYPAIGMNLSRGLCLNFGIGGINYQTDKSENPEAINPSNTFNFSFGRMVNVGISKNFNMGHKMHVRHEPGDEVIHRNLEHVGNNSDDDDAPRLHRRTKSGDNDE